MSTIRMDRLSWVEYQGRVREEHAPVILPVGATEQHGPHLPLGTDALLATAVAESVAPRVRGLVAPTLAYGFKSQPKCGGGQHFDGTTSLDAATLIGSVRDTVREFARHGVRKLVVVNGHYENQWFLIEGIDLAMREVQDLAPYRAVVAGSAIRKSKWLPEAAEFVQAHHVALSQKPFAMFTVCITLAMSNGDQYRSAVSAWVAPVRARVKPVSEAFFAGLLDFSKLPLNWDTLMLRAAVAFGIFPRGDRRDWNAIRAWASDLKPILEA